MLSKIIISTTILVVVCFKSSESIEIKDCLNDDNFLEVAEINKDKNIPILVTTAAYPGKNEDVVNYLNILRYETVIKVYADNDQCSITNEYLKNRYSFSEHEEITYPALFMMRKNYLYNGVWRADRRPSIEQFCQRAVKALWSETSTTTVTQTIGDAIARRGLMNLAETSLSRTRSINATRSRAAGLLKLAVVADMMEPRNQTEGGPPSSRTRSATQRRYLDSNDERQTRRSWMGGC